MDKLRVAARRLKVTYGEWLDAGLAYNRLVHELLGAPKQEVQNSSTYTIEIDTKRGKKKYEWKKPEWRGNFKSKRRLR